MAPMKASSLNPSISYVTKDDAPFLIYYSDDDPNVKR